VIKLKV